ncbi:hypothetical protein Hanom_Chr06g00570371 [Helianthus anomalus]
MAESSNPFSTSGENPEPPSPVAAEEEEVEVNAPGKNLLVLRWSRLSFEMLMRDIQMPPEYGATYPQEGGIASDARAGYVTMFADFFGGCNLRLPLTVFVAEVLEYYKIHIFQLSPLGMIRVRNFEYTFHALGVEPIVGDFQRFYQLSVSVGFFSFHQREHTPKLMIPPKGMTKWKTNFFYIKVAAITAKFQFRSVTGTIITENIGVPKADTVDWFPDLRISGWVKLDNRQLWVLRMMLGRMSRHARPVVREKSGEKAPLWRMFCPDFKGEVSIVACTDGEEGFNRTIRDNFRLPHRAALEAGLGVPGGAAAAGGLSAGTKPVDDKKRKGDAPVAGGQKAPKLRRTRATAIPKPTHAVTTGKLIICYTSVVIPVVTNRCFL